LTYLTRPVEEAPVKVDPVEAKPIETKLIETKLEGYGDAEYEQIEIGMTVSEINEIIGFEGELMGESIRGRRTLRNICMGAKFRS
jgi:hypothetical protein